MAIDVESPKWMKVVYIDGVHDMGDSTLESRKINIIFSELAFRYRNPESTFQAGDDYEDYRKYHIDCLCSVTSCRDIPSN